MKFSFIEGLILTLMGAFGVIFTCVVITIVFFAVDTVGQPNIVTQAKVVRGQVVYDEDGGAHFQLLVKYKDEAQWINVSHGVFSIKKQNDDMHIVVTKGRFSKADYYSAP